ncbi:restriction endonuclease subunit S [Enterococcus faecium]|uniref:restriction endonuclease subunit S n=1 Tax=Enterococcus faecium TaxID=1352 RepID=UPI002EAD3263|nr:restriction endonuclease subunit S [Enterococcus hirae]
MSNDTQPEIRFPGFTEAWEQRKLGEFVTIRSGWSPSNFEEANDKGSLFVKVDDLNSSTRVQNNSNMKVIENPKYDKMKQGSTIFPKRGAAIMTNKVRILGENGYMDTNMMALEPSGIVGEFLYTFISRTGLYKIADTSTIPQINNKHIEPYEISLPEIKEQQKIGIFFKQLDDTITLHQSKLDLLKETKKGFLQKMFPKNGAKVPEIRFPGFTEDWEQRKLGDLTTWTKGQGLTKEDLNKERDGSEAVHYADLYKFSPVMHEVIHWTNSDDGRIIPDNSLLFPASDVTPVGLARTSTLRLSGVKAGGDVIIGQLNESINSSFMSYQINANSKKILPLITGTTVKHIQAKSLATVSVSITNMAEQTAIAGIFEQLDDTITLHQRKLDLLKETKKGFLQKMFV